jgi:hypothetical protein
MEVYGVSSCDELPDSAFLFFNQETVYQSGRPMTPSWSAGSAGATSPNCNASGFGNQNIGFVTWNPNG